MLIACASYLRCVDQFAENDLFRDWTNAFNLLIHYLIYLIFLCLFFIGEAEGKRGEDADSLSIPVKSFTVSVCVYRGPSG